MKKIEEIRGWMAVCEKAGIAEQIPEQLHVMDAYARLLEAKLAARDEAIVKPWREAVEESERVLEVVNDVLDKKGYQRMVSIDMTIGKLRALLNRKEAE